MIGELSDKGMSDDGKMIARIDDVPFVCIPKTYPFLERLEKGWQVGYELNEENQIIKIFRAPKPALPKEDGFTTADRMKKAGFNVPEKETMTESEVAALKARGEEAKREKAHAEEMAAKSKEAKEQSKDKPLESGIKIVQGQIVSFDAGAHSLTVKDIKGESHPMMWKGPLTASMEKLKQWFFVSISAEKSGEIWVVIDQTYYKKPAEWPVSQKSGYGGGKPFTPRNERIIVLQSCCKLAAEVFAITTCPDTVDFDSAMDCIIARAIKDTETLMAAGKVQP